MTSTTIAAHTITVACCERMDEDSNKRPSPRTEEFEHLDKRPRWTTTTTICKSLSIDSNLSTRTEASASSSVASQGGDTMHISAHQVDDLEAVILEDLVDQMATWSVTNLKEWRRQQSRINSSSSSSSSSSNGTFCQKEKFRMARSEMLQAVRRSNAVRVTTTTNASVDDNGNLGEHLEVDKVKM